MNKKARIAIVLIIAGAVSAGTYWWEKSSRDTTDPDALVLYGNVDIREVRLAFNGSEHVDSILVEEGDQVKAGQLLARLHTDRLQTSLDSARANLHAIQAEAHVASLSYQRIRTMAERKLASREEADEAEGKSRAANARVGAAEAALAQAEQLLRDAQLHAPVNGIIRDRIVEPGDFVTPQTPILTLALLDPVWIRTYLPESYLGKVKPGMPARISTDSYPGKVYQGWVGSISPSAEFTPKNVETPELRTRLVYQLRVYVCNPQLELRLGMPATVHLDFTATPPDDETQQRCPSSTPDLEQ